MGNIQVELIEGKKLFHQRARATFPFLVRQAKAGRPIYYSDLMEEVNSSGRLSNGDQIKNVRHFNRILDEIVHGIAGLRKITQEKIPRIQDIVINKSTQLPGYYKDDIEFQGLSTTQRRRRLDIELIKVYSYKNWDWVLQKLKLLPITSDLSQEIKALRSFAGRGESEAHKAFKEYIRNNPNLLDLNKNIKGKVEHCLLSGDKIDVLFQDDVIKIGVEVKSKISNTADILRGLFQCIKYKHLLEAEDVLADRMPNCRVILALESSFPQELKMVKNLFGIEVFESIRNSH